jgi:hypothetical protein
VNDALLGKIALGALSMALLFSTAGCRKPPNPEDAHRVLTGKWRLIVKTDCAHWGVASDILILHPDGRMEQHLKLLNGKKYDSAQEHWEYLPDHSISLDRRLTVTDPQYAGTPQLEVLIVEFSQPPVILLNPHQNCFYEPFSSEQ